EPPKGQVERTHGRNRRKHRDRERPVEDGFATWDRELRQGECSRSTDGERRYRGPARDEEAVHERTSEPTTREHVLVVRELPSRRQAQPRDLVFGSDRRHHLPQKGPGREQRGREGGKKKAPPFHSSAPSRPSPSKAM